MYRFESTFSEVVDQSIHEVGSFDLRPDDSDEVSLGASPYLAAHRHEYIRTVQDVVQTLGSNSQKRVLEIGAFFGVVCVSLAKLGFNVTAADIPEYIDLSEQQRRFKSFNVSTVGLRLENFKLPFDDESFDAVIMCEVLEHLNFNPLPLIKEINRVCKTSGLFYLSLPNQASIYNRISLLRGRAIQVSVDSFFEQLTSHVIVNGHWREYTLEDVNLMLTRLGFVIPKHYYFSYGETKKIKNIRSLLARGVYEFFPMLKENQTAIAIKKERSEIAFSIPLTVHQTLRSI
jgi:2-polyprenyl-3-methyl-5-hydroxy-6-metoxy-1,4-benzoquinol methylase